MVYNLHACVNVMECISRSRDYKFQEKNITSVPSPLDILFRRYALYSEVNVTFDQRYVTQRHYQ